MDIANLETVFTKKRDVVIEVESRNILNPFEEIFAKISNTRPFEIDIDISNGISEMRMREELVHKYSWAVPNEEALAKIASFSPIIEIGAGTGYWAKRIVDHGGKIVAFDRHPEAHKHYNVAKGDWRAVSIYPDHTLFLCWPPYNESLAYDCLHAYKGKHIIYVGEHDGGCTANDKFHKILEDKWETIEIIDIPQWWGIHDRVYICRRK